MMIWRWHDTPGAWFVIQLHRGTNFPLHLNALFVPLQGRQCGLLARGEVMINGLTAFPLRMLADRDEIRVGGETVYFSADSPAEAVAFPAQTEAACGRCKGMLKAGELAVQCPLCRAWHHQTEELPCWQHAARCSGCERSTERIGWQPEPLWRKQSARKGRTWKRGIHASAKQR